MADTGNKVPAERDADKGRGLERSSGRSPFDTFQRQAERMFIELNRSLGMPFPRTWFRGRAVMPGEDAANIPAVDIAEKDGRYEITAELPGLDENNIELRIARRVLTIRGEKSEEREENRKNVSLSERHFGSFERSFAIPDDADADNISASFKQGVLTVTLLKKPGAETATRTIPVKAG